MAAKTRRIETKDLKWSTVPIQLLIINVTQWLKQAKRKTIQSNQNKSNKPISAQKTIKTTQGSCCTQNLLHLCYIDVILQQLRGESTS